MDYTDWCRYNITNLHTIVVWQYLPFCHVYIRRYLWIRKQFLDLVIVQFLSKMFNVYWNKEACGILSDFRKQSHYLVKKFWAGCARMVLPHNKLQCEMVIKCMMLKLYYLMTKGNLIVFLRALRFIPIIEVKVMWPIDITDIMHKTRITLERYYKVGLLWYSRILDNYNNKFSNFQIAHLILYKLLYQISIILTFKQSNF